MQVVKRNGKLVEFDFVKIENAIKNAWREVRDEAPEKTIDTVMEYVSDAVSKVKEKVLQIDEIQDIVEYSIMMVDPEVAKAFILYRYEKDKNRTSVKQRFEFLSDEFLSPYKHKPDPLNEIGSFVFYRTYSRFIPELGRRERWWETVARAVNYNISLSPKSTKEEAEDLFDNIYNLKQQLSGEIRPLY